MIGGFVGFNQNDGGDWGENLLNKVASQTIRHLFTRSESVEVAVRCQPSSKLLQGTIDSFKMSGRGLVIRREFRTYEESLADAGINWQELLASSTVAIPIVHAEFSLFRPMFCGDKLLITLAAKQIDEHQFAIDYQISDHTSLQKSLVQGHTKHICINPLTRGRAKLPELIILWLQTFA